MEVQGEHALVESGGLRRRVVIAFVPDARPGDYVLVHAGFAIRKWTASDMAEYERIVASSTSQGAEG